MTQENKDLVAQYIEPISELDFNQYQICTDQLFHNVALFVATDLDGQLFAKQHDDNFVLPYLAYKKEILGYSYNVEHLKKEPAPQYYTVPTRKNEVCNVLAMYKNQPQ